ncbi:hypothetical protein GALMADRAFT_221686 [Galerina marginata CBS 339.88]|uniref:M-phase inducer phosphatase n=1 Tax=Galerina marginata (strain CBS 339.88) TaxID=685588 RepID=A0A067TF12_GALM3|nr:hypothetical protein GALMADRAFT_221686 [Galerina marginata CBS 339.88]
MSFLNPPLAPSRKKSQRFLLAHNNAHDVDFLSSDLEISFASNVSLNSPPHEQASLPASDCEPMDISPAPAPKHISLGLNMSGQRPRAFTSGARLFGSDISNNNGLMPSPAMGDTSKATQSGTKKIQRSALPFEWLAASRPAELPEPIQEPSSPMDDAMDVDTSYNVSPATVAPVSLAFSPEPAAPAAGATNFDQLFYDTMSPPRRSFDSPGGLNHRKRRSLSPESAKKPRHELSSSPVPMLPSSPSEAKLNRMAANGKPGLQGLGAAPSASFLKRPRRPVLSAMVQPYDHHIQSAYPILSPPSTAQGQVEDDSPRGSAPVRRAFSAFLPPSVYGEQGGLGLGIGMQDESESSFEHDGNDMSSPAQAYSRRQQVKTIRRCDGTEDFRPLTGATAMVQKESPSAKLMAATGLPGFGDNEKHGKILPCHRVTEDGLMRITTQTVDDLLDGKYNDAITDFHVIDCRFDYEYNGGHIPGAVNINTTNAVEELLLGKSLTKPRPSVSGDSTRKTILVFHCEFSAKRAPTFAKHLRARDRAMNNQSYPKIHYPEVYILEGGYCQYFKTSSHRCKPAAYVTMDDPNHATSRREDLDQFRKAKFGRHKSYAYGDNGSKGGLPFGQTQQQQQQPKRNTAPSGSAPLSMFAAATAARSRRGGNALVTLVEQEGNATVDADAEDTDTDLGDSPCPPPIKSAGSFKSGSLGMKKMGMTGRGMVRAETYGPARFGLGL